MNERYKIENIIGRGGLSIVYRATDLEANGAVRAVKEISKKCIELVCSAKQESQLIKELYEHDTYNFFPNIIQRIENENSLYIVMDFIDGISMNKMLKNGAVSYSETIEYGKEICSVIQFLHEYGKIYSDMKPDNIMVINHGNSDFLTLRKHMSKIKLIDFGAVVHMESGIPAQYTPEYAAPEQFRAQRLDKRTDIFNIGATLYHISTGKKPISISDGTKEPVPSNERFKFEYNDKIINTHLKKIILKCVNDNPEKRYRSCRELYRDLERAENNSYIKLTMAASAMTIFFSAICIFSYNQYLNCTDNAYLQYIRTAEKSTVYSEKINAYKNAINLKKEKTDAYFGLIATYKEDTVFDEKESAELTRLITSNHDLLSENEDYRLLAFETGKLYWYYYDYGTENNDANSTTRIISSTEWFAEAADSAKGQLSDSKYHMSKIYYDIGKFHSDIQKLVIEGDDTGVYYEYWNSLNSMSDFIEENGTESEIVLLETYKLILNSLETYAYKFAAFVTYEEQKNLFEKIKNKTESIVTTTEKTEQIRKCISERYSQTQSVIENAYGVKT